jgi:hypothetical protein
MREIELRHAAENRAKRLAQERREWAAAKAPAALREYVETQRQATLDASRRAWSRWERSTMRGARARTGGAGWNGSTLVANAPRHEGGR